MTVTEAPEPRALKRTRACVPCHDRKVRCDAAKVGIPCTRCIRGSHENSCVLVTLSQRSSVTKRRRTDGPGMTEGRPRSLSKSQPGSVNTRSLEFDEGECIIVDRQARQINQPQQLQAQQPQAEQSQAQQPQTEQQQVQQPQAQQPQAQRLQQETQLASLYSNQQRLLQITGPATTDHSAVLHNTIRRESEPTLDPGSSLSPSGQLSYTPSSTSPAVEEDDSQIQICRHMSQWVANATTSPTRVGQLNQGREVIEYHGGINQMTILSEVFGKMRPKRLVRMVLNDKDVNPLFGSDYSADSSRVEGTHREYLQKMGAFDLPQRQVCDKLLRLYFDCVYPYAPIFDRIEFMREYEEGSCSKFLLQAILASVASYASTDLIRDAGFPNHLTAQKTFFSRASLICDLGAESRQVRLLQGSLVLSLLNFSFAIDKDYRYWLSNAVRIATQMGLHRDSVAKDLDISAKPLFRRLWWVIYNRDALLVSSGLDNVRRIHESDFDTAELELSDWEREIIPEKFKEILPPVTQLQRVFLIQSCKLSRIGAQYVETSRASAPVVAKAAWRQFEDALGSWRCGLPNEMRVEGVSEWSVSNIWPLVLQARSYLLECIVYRTLKQNLSAEGPDSGDTMLAARTIRRLKNATFELDTVVDRVMLHDLARFCPLYLVNCVSTLLALHIEIALHRSTSNDDRITARTRIHHEMRYLRSLSEYWNSIKWAFRLFEVIVARTGLSLNVTQQPIFDAQSSDPFNAGDIGLEHPIIADVDRNGYNTNKDHGAMGTEMLPELFMQDELFNPINIDDSLGTMMGRHTEDWLYDLFGNSLGGLGEYGACVE